MSIDRDLHRELGKSLNGEVWKLLQQETRTGDEDRLMVHAVHASLYHWLRAGTGVNEQRGEWLISRVYAVLGLGEAALRHAERCRALTEEHRAELKDFDLAYAEEALARAQAVLGSIAEAARHKDAARRLGEMIVDPEDRAIFTGDLEAGDWRGAP